VGGIGAVGSAENKYDRVKLGASHMSFWEIILGMILGSLFKKRGTIKLKSNDVGWMAQDSTVVKNI
jgi:hypothetical protein